MNKVAEHEYEERNIQIFRSSSKMFTETKIAKVILYLVTFIPLVLVLTQDMFVTDATTANIVKFTSSAVSIILNILTELVSNIIANHKEKAVLLAQLFETQITGRKLSKMEYDRETTNELYELAIRKGTLKKAKTFTGAYDVPQEIDDKYSYLFINRYIAAETRFLLDKLQIIYGVIITVVSILFVFLLSNMHMSEAVYYIVCFWSVFIPIVRNFAKCTKNRKQCVKISADIDNYFAEGDDSIEKLYRFNAYIQSISFEMRNNLVTMPAALRYVFAYQIKVLDVGVTNRFIEAIFQHENLVLEKKGMKANRRKHEWISRNGKKDNDSAEEKKEIIRKAKTAVLAAENAAEKEKIANDKPLKPDGKKRNVSAKEIAVAAAPTESQPKPNAPVTEAKKSRKKSTLPPV